MKPFLSGRYPGSVRLSPLSRAVTRNTALVFLLFLLSPAGFPRSVGVTCGTEPTTRHQFRELHRRNRADLRAFPERLRAASPASVERDIGDIAILEDRGDLIAQPKSFNLSGNTLRFTPAGPFDAGYRFALGPGDYSDADASAGSPLQGLGDDDTRLVNLPFPFPFFGGTWSQVFLNSDGNLTFGRGDTSISERSLGRFASGPPRIAPLFTDLDPSRAGQVRVLADATRAVVTWVEVPPYTSFGIGTPQSFQVRLHANGAVEFAWKEVTLSDSIVGLAPGDLQGGTTLVSFTAGGEQTFSGAIAERFTTQQELDVVFAAQRFFETHDDVYDYLVFYNNVGLNCGAGAIACEIPVRSKVEGIGDPIGDDGPLYGSRRRLLAVMHMGPLSQYRRDPFALVPGRELAGDTALSVLGHEAGHLYLAFASVRDPRDPLSYPMLGRDFAHWSFFFNSDASLLEGNRIQDNGPGASPRFTTIGSVEGFSALDQYLMGLLPPEEVPPSFVVTQPSSNLPTNSQPRRGVSFNGERFDVNIHQLIAAEGRRVPDHTVAQRRFRFAFIFVTPAGQEPSTEEIAQLEEYRRLFDGYYANVSGGAAVAESVLRRGFDITAHPATGILLGGTATATVELPAPAATPFTVLLRPLRGAVSAPASVTVPAGQRRATFELRGEREGVDELIAEPVDTAYATVHSFVPVLPNSQSLRVRPASGENQRVIPGEALRDPVVVRVVDANNVPYAGIAVQASVANGAVQPAAAATDALGEVRFQWSPGAGPVQDLTVEVAGVPNSAAVIPALAEPFIGSNAVVNAASFRPGLSPGGFATIFGANLTGGFTLAVPVLPLPSDVLGIRVLVNNVPAPLSYLSDRQLNFVVPGGIAPGQATVTVEAPGQRVSAPAPVAVRLLDPGIFPLEAGEGAILIAGTMETTFRRPAAAGEVIEIYCTGLGPTQPSTRIFGLRETVNLPSVLIGGQPAQVLFSGLSPIYPGLYQVNAAIPAGLAPGDQPLEIRFTSGERSNEVKVRVR